MKRLILISAVLGLLVSAAIAGGEFSLKEDEVIALVGQENFVREQKSGTLESLFAVAFVDQKPCFRSMAWEADTVFQQWRDVTFGSWAEQLEVAGVTMVIAQYGQMEALGGREHLSEFTAAYHRLLDQFAARTKRLVLVSPMPFEKPEASRAPDLSQRNGDVAVYSQRIGEIAAERGAIFVDLYTPLSARESVEGLTRDGIHLTDSGLRVVAGLIGDALGAAVVEPVGKELRAAVVEKNELWFDCWRPANWSFVYGDRVNQLFGKGGGSQPSLQVAFERQQQFVEAADARIHAIARGEAVAALELPPAMVSSEARALSPEEQLATFELADGYEVNLFASEADGVVNPTQFAWDERGRLYVACSPSYPQSLAGAPAMDYILICEDTDGDGRADKSWKFAEGLSMVQGVELGDGGVYVCDFDQLLHLSDVDGDGVAERRRVVFSGFGVGDTHQLVNSICHGPDGSLWFSQGLHAMSRVETPWGVARLDRAAIWRMDPRSLRLEGFFGGGMAGANCWGIAFDDYGQVFHKSGDRPQGYWSVPGMVRGASPSGSGSEFEASASYADSPQQYHSVGALFDSSPKTTSLEIIGTRALPDEIQGCALIGGYFGSVVELHRFHDHGSGFRTTQLPKLMKSTNNAFRPVDVGVGPDGAIYLADWYNPIIGHYQASYADPKRDKSHGRIWRITAKGRDSVKPPDLAAMSPRELVAQLRSPERWTRYQAKRLLFDMATPGVLAAVEGALARVGNGQELVELAGVFVAHDAVSIGVLERLSASADPRVRAYGMRLASRWAGGVELLRKGSVDSHPRVRLESIIGASYLETDDGIAIAMSALDHPRDGFIDYALRLTAKSMQPSWSAALATGKLKLGSAAQRDYLEKLQAEEPKPVSPGAEVYATACLTCHQPEGKGLAGVYPPLTGSERVSDPDSSALVKIVLHGLAGPVEVAGNVYGAGTNAIPMPPMGGLSDAQIADVLSYIRGEFGGGADEVTAETVKKIRAESRNRESAWTVEALGE